MTTKKSVEKCKKCRHGEYNNSSYAICKLDYKIMDNSINCGLYVEV